MPGSEMRFKGKVKWFNNSKGYGFINEDNLTEDLFAHYSAIQMDGYKTLKAGQPVTFEKIQGPKGVHATAISLVAVETDAIPAPLKNRATEPH
jgi:CspA family cold shock protein